MEFSTIDVISIIISAFSLLASVGSLFVAIYSILRTNTIRRQDMQEPLYENIHRLLKDRCSYFSAELKVIDCDVPVPNVTLEKEKRIVRQVRRFFGVKEYKQLRQILKLCRQANSINHDMSILFDTIEQTNPQQYVKLRDALIMEQRNITESEYEKIQAFLASIKIPFLQFAADEPGKSYDYLDLQSKLLKLNEQINEKKKILEENLQDKMMAR